MELYNLSTPEKLTIAVNNEQGIVAVGPVMASGGGDAPAGITARVVLIDRRKSDLNFNLT